MNTSTVSNPAASPNATPALDTITLGGGCFWCLEAVYELVDGVVAVESGYSQGHVQRPSYEQVCRGDTGHVEIVQLRFDPSRVSLRELLEIFFVIHDPTQLNRQGNDVGPQYRSGIYVTSDEQAALAHTVVAEVQAELDRQRGGSVVTEIEPLRNHWPAEAYHQHYFARNPGQGYCAFVVAPKVEKFRRTFAQKMKRPA
jgi:peptide-methionine (S)-S-oxide reductase